MRIGEFAARAGVTSRQIRYYTSLGLLATRRQANGYRDYDDCDLPRARRLRTVFAIGLTAAQVRQIEPCLNDETTTFCQATRNALATQLDAIDGRIEQLQNARSLIARQLQQP